MGRTPNKLVFLNCPFDPEFRPLFEALVFTIVAGGYHPHCALEIIDSGYLRLTKIIDLIDLCDFSLHDISRTELNSNHLPRFNMPFELGLALGRKHHRTKARRKLLVLDCAPHRYLEYISDLRGCDPASHNGEVHQAIAEVRHWLSSHEPVPLNGPSQFQRWFERYSADLPAICEQCGLDRDQLSFADLLFSVRFWSEANIPVA